MVYHIYKHRIVLPIQGFGFIGKQADPSLQEGRAMPERRERVSSPRRDPCVSSSLKCRSPGISIPLRHLLATPFLPRAMWSAEARAGLCLCFCDFSPLWGQRI